MEASSFVQLCGISFGFEPVVSLASSLWAGGIFLEWDASMGQVELT